MTRAQDSCDSRRGHNGNASPATIGTPTPRQASPTEAEERVARIRALNDRLRTTGRGGMTVITNGVAALGLERVREVFDAVASFTDFSSDNDPWGEHDCTVLTVGTTSVIWKIDNYDRTRRYRSPDPADPKVTVRVLTIMTADEY
jgi:hypothetical protein